MAPLLSADLLQLQLETLELAQSLFPLDGELVLDDASAAALPSLRARIAAGDASGSDSVKVDELSFAVTLELVQEGDPSSPYPLVLQVRIPLTPSVDPWHTLPDGASAATVHLQQPAWLSRTAHDALAASLPSANPRTFSTNIDLLIETFDYARTQALAILPPPVPPSADPGAGAGRAPPGGRRRRRAAPARNGDGDPESLQEYRVWLWFPSLSTREKRDDIVNWAADFDITGFVMAGKPAIMCLEGTESDVQAYLSEIKAKSWADIPSFQKKVSERYRTPLRHPRSPSGPDSGPTDDNDDDPTCHRIFSDMSEITSLIARTGGRSNRGEMGDVRDFLAAKGLADAFGAVVGGGQFS